MRAIPTSRALAAVAALLAASWTAYRAEAGREGDRSAGPEATTVSLTGPGIAVEVDQRGALAVTLRDASGTPHLLTRAPGAGAPTAAVILNGQRVADFTRTAARLEKVSGALGPGRRLTVQARSASQPLLRTLILEAADAHPGVLYAKTIYRSTRGVLKPERFIEHAFELRPLDPPVEGPAFWSFQGVAKRWGEDYVLPVPPGFERRNEAPLYGGVPYCDLYSRGGGLGVGSAALTPQTLSLPVAVWDGSAAVAIEWPGKELPPDRPVEVGTSLV